MQSGDHISPNPQMESQMMRLASFSNMPSTELSATMASKAGLYYTGVGDTVACYSCGLRLNRWASGVQPMVIHRRLSPECQFVISQQPPSVPMDVDTRQMNGTSGRVSQSVPAGRVPEHTSTNNTSHGAIRTSQQVTPAEHASRDVPMNGERGETNSQNRGRRRGPRHRPNSNRQQSNYLSMLASVAGSGNWSAHVNTGRTSQRRDTIDSITSMLQGLNNSNDDSGATNIMPAASFTDTVDSPENFSRRVNNNDPTLLEEMKYERRRLSTYSEWPRATVDIAPEALAGAGLFYLGLADRVKCPFCGGILRNWEPSDDPRTEHRRNFPHCLFLRNPTAAGNVAIGEEPPLNEVLNVTGSRASGGMGADELGIQTGQARHPHMATESTRLATFDTWPRSSPVTPDRLARAGFYNEGMDRVCCFFCNGRLDHWQPGDDPMTEHRRHFPHCGFVRLMENEHTSPAPANTTNTTSRAADLMASAMATILGLPTAAPAATATPAAAGATPAAAPAAAPAASAASPAAAAAPENTNTGASSQGQSMVCKVCLDADMNTVILPCGHLACCANCASALNICPICRGRIEGRVRTYMS